MSPPLTILLADDQVPWETDAENERTKAEMASRVCKCHHPLMEWMLVC